MKSAQNAQLQITNETNKLSTLFLLDQNSVNSHIHVSSQKNEFLNLPLHTLPKEVSACNKVHQL